MGFVYLTKGKRPAFITFKRLNNLLRILESTGRIQEVTAADELFGGKTVTVANKAINKYLKELEKENEETFLKHYYSFDCEGQEAKDNLFPLLSAVSIAQKFPVAGFTDGSNDSDIRYPYGKQYTFVFGSKKSLFRLQVDTNQVVKFFGNLNSVVIVFNGYYVSFENRVSQFGIAENCNISYNYGTEK